MNKSTKNTFRLISLIAVILVILMQLSIVIIPVLVPHSVWIMIIAYFLLFLSVR